MGVKKDVQSTGGTPQANASELEKLVELYKTFKVRSLDLDKQYENERKALLESSGRNEEEVEKIILQRKTAAMDSLLREFAVKDESYTDLIKQVSEMSSEQLKKTLDKAASELAKLSVEGGDELQKVVAQMKITTIKSQIDNNTKNQPTDENKKKDFFSGDGLTKIIGDFQQWQKEIDVLIEKMGFLDANTRQMLKSASAIASGTIEMILGMKKMADVANTSMTALEKGSVIFAVVGALMKTMTAIFNFGDTKASRKISLLDLEVNGLKNSYDELGRVIKETFSDEVFASMNSQIKNLQNQKELIQQQSDLEKGKKKTDKSKVEQYEKSLIDIDNKIADNQKKQMEMFAGTNVQNAIDKFADSLVAAYGKGEIAAQALGETTKKVLSNAVKEALKRQFLGDGINNAVKYLSESMKSGNELTAQEQEEFKRLVEAAGTSFYNAMGAYDELFKNTDIAAKDAAQSTSGQLQASITEGTASALVGLWNSSSLDIRRLKEIAEIQRTEPVPVEIYSPVSADLQLFRGLSDEQLQAVRSGTESIRELLNQSMYIEQNTRRTADNTGTIITELQSGFGKLEGQLSTIEKNTKGSKSRG